MNNPLLFPNPNKTLSRSLLLWLFAFWGVLSTPLLGSELNPSANSASDCPAEAAQVEAVEVGCIAGTLDLEATVIAEPVIPHHFEQIFLLASGANRTIIALNDQPQFTIDEAGEYSIHSLVYRPSSFNPNNISLGDLRVAELVLFFEQGGGVLCGALDTQGAGFHIGACPCDAEAGTLNAAGVCFDNNLAEIKSAPSGDAVIPAGFEIIYVLTSGNDLLIEGVNETPEFIVSTDKNYRIHPLVYDPSTLDLSIVEIGVTTGFEVNSLLLQGNGSICASLNVEGTQFNFRGCDACLANAGTLVADSDNCLDGAAELIASEDTAPNVPAGFEVLYVLTSGNGLVIQDVNDTPQFTVAETGLFTIHTLVYDPATLDLSIVEFGVTTGVDVNNLLIQGGGDICASLLVAGAQFQVEECPCTADAGTLTADSDNCLDGDAALVAAEDTAPNVPAGYEVIYVLTSGNGLVIQDVNATPEFTVTDTGLYTIHTLVYNPLTLDLSIVEFGVTTGVDVNNLLIQGGGDICASLLVAGAQFQVEACCTADAGTLLADSDNCLDGEAELIASEDTAPNVPAGFEVLYVLTSGNDLVIQDVNDTPQFTVAETGLFTIHTLVYDPATLDLSIVEFGVTTGVDVNNLLIQGGGDICASLLVAGAQFQVEECPCTADAGTLTADSDNCLDGDAALVAAEDTAPNVPAGYEVIYVLTSGNGLVIQDVNATPEFTVTDTGLYTIHTLVYNPLTLDLSIVEFGVTTGVDVNNLLIQGGGDICASLLVAGAQFQVEACCTADAGSLLADSDNCLDGEAELIASEDTAPNVPAGFEVLYVLTSGNGLVIQDVNDTPQFTVAETGLFTIHTLVYDPATLDLSIVEFGVTTGVDVNNLLIQGGGDICASLLVAGAQFQVEECPCTADAGTLTADSDNCLDGDAALVATEDTTPNVPAGYEVIYVLTSGNGLVIQDVNATPEFTVTDTGLYTIHTLVYNPLTLDLSIVEFGVTTGVDVNNLLIQGGGDICASLLVAGAQFQVEECPCTAEAGTLIADSDNCLDGTAELTAVEGQAPVIPNGYERLFVLTSGTDLVIEAVNTDPTFTIEETGLFTIHTLIYNPLTLDLSIVEFGVTTGVDVNGLLVQGGGDICAALDVAGAAFQVEPCPTLLEKAPYPNPVSDQLYVPVADWMIGSDLTIHLNDANGKLVREIKVEEANALEVIDMRQMTPGGYTLVVYHSDGTRGMVRRIIKM